MEYRETRNDEQEIDLKDLLFNILYKWRSLLGAAVLVGVLAMGYAAQYNAALPEKKAGIQEQLDEQKQLLGALGEGQSADPIQKEINRLQESLDGLKSAGIPKYGLLGFGGGLAVLIFFYGMGYVCSDRLRGERELREKYGYYMLGQLPPKRKKRFLSGLDRLLQRLAGVSVEMTEDDAYWIISINIINLAKSGGMFLVTGTVGAERLQEVAEALSARLEEVTLVAGADMNATASTLEMLAECDAVILVEERGRSLRAKIHEEHESIAALEKPVIGYVIL